MRIQHRRVKDVPSLAPLNDVRRWAQAGCNMCFEGDRLLRCLAHLKRLDLSRSAVDDRLLSRVVKALCLDLLTETSTVM